MSTLVLARHAQARPFEKITDQLSPVGEQQAALLGEYWRQRSIVFDEVYCGTLERHRRTAELAGLKNATCDPAFNEYPADALLRAYPKFHPTRDNREFQAMFEEVMRLWLAGKLEGEELETWPEFRERVTRGLSRIFNSGKSSRRVLVFTSGGPIGVAVQTVLRAPEEVAVEINWRVRNCSLTEFLFSSNRVSLDIFNATPHLSQVTFR